MKKTPEIVYFELNNWAAGENYPNTEPFKDWFADDCNQAFQSLKWVKKNGLCVVHCFIDMSDNYCITATKDWVENKCPELLTKYTKFLCYPDPDGEVYGKWDNKFLHYDEKNIGIHFQFLDCENGEWCDDNSDNLDKVYEDAQYDN